MNAFTFDGIHFTAAVPDFIHSFRLVIDILNKSEPKLVEPQKQAESENTCHQKPCSGNPILPVEQGDTAIEEDKSDIDSDTDTEFTSCLNTESEVSDVTIYEDALVNELGQRDGLDGEQDIGVKRRDGTVLASNIQQMRDNDLRLQLEPKVHVLRLPGFMVDSDEPASDLEQIYEAFEKNLFKDNFEMDWISHPSHWL
uniref:Uncharacterized protein n=1 Tax=Tetranychus urticae TaxID=32264 RepID=T1KQE4_TETUR